MKRRLDFYDTIMTSSTIGTVKPRYNAPAFNIILPRNYINFGSKKYLYNYLYISNNEKPRFKA